MEVKFLVAIASENWAYRPGEVVELDDEIAKAWIAAGTCVPSDEEKIVKVLNPKNKK